MKRPTDGFDRAKALTLILGAFLLAAILGLAAGRADRPAAASPALPQAAAQAPADPAATRVFLPALGGRETSFRCQGMVNVVALGPEPTKAILLIWPGPWKERTACRAPAIVRCSGLLRPGSGWDFIVEGEPTSEIGAGVLYSFSARRLSAIGATVAGDPVAADLACERLTRIVVGNCAAYSAFAAAFNAGRPHFGIPLDRAAGSPLAAHVYRACPGDGSSRVVVSSTYEGTGAQALGVRDADFGGYRYHAAPIDHALGNFVSRVYIQNAGVKPATVDVWLKADGDCGDSHRCAAMTIDPGASAVFDPDGCAQAGIGGWRGSALLRGTEPLAVVVDTIGHDTLATFSAVAPQPLVDPTGAILSAAAPRAAFGPLAFDPAYGWQTEVTVQNLDLTATADIVVELLDAGGAALATRTGAVCAGGSTTFLLPPSAHNDGSRAGSIRVVSRPPAGGDPSDAAPITAVATLRQLADTPQEEIGAAIAYNLEPASGLRAAADGGIDDTHLGPGAPIVVVPAWWKDLDSDVQVTSELAISNYVAIPGWTDVAIIVYDQNDRVDVLCRRIGAGQTAYIDLQTMGLVPPGFRGSAVVSATHWEHAAPADSAESIRRRVGLGAVAVIRTRSVLGHDVPGDEAAGAVGIPLAAWPDVAGLPVDACGMAPAAVPAPAPGGYWQSIVPVYAYGSEPTTRLSFRNEGDRATEVKLYFKAMGDCLRDRVCTLFLRPRATVTYEAIACVGTGWRGSMALHSREPLAMSAALIGPGPALIIGVRPGRFPADVDGNGRVDLGDRAAITAALGTAPGAPGWSWLADIDASSRVNDEDLAMFDHFLCGADRPADAPAIDPPPPRGAAAYVPSLRLLGDDPVCDAAVTAQNVGAEPAKYALVIWGAASNSGACRGPIAVTCGGLVRPGGAWYFAAAVLPDGAASGAIFSFNARPLSALGASAGGDEPAADYLCRALAATVGPDCTPFGRFKEAFDIGGDLDGVPLGKAMGGAIVADVRRDCPASLTPGVAATASYTGFGAHRLGAPDPSSGAYSTHVPLIYGDKAGFRTLIAVQNAGDRRTRVAVSYMAQDDCSRLEACTVRYLGPGEALVLDPSGGPGACVSLDWQGSAVIESFQPLATTVDIVGRDVLMTYEAVAPLPALDPNGAPLPAGGRTTAFGPLFVNPESGWDTGIQVQNLSLSRPAQVRVEFLDGRGAPVATLDDVICAAGSQTFFLPIEPAVMERHVGSVRVVSERLGGDPSTPPAPIVAIATMIQYVDPFRTRAAAGLAYTLLSEREALARLPDAAGGTSSGVGAVALAGVARAGGGRGVTTELAISNLVPAPGWTAVAVLLYDANGLVDIACRRIDAGAVDYLDLGSLGLTPSFHGSAIVSATHWHHPFSDGGRGPLRNLVGLGAVALTRSTVPDREEPALAEGVPLARVPAAIGGNAVARCAAWLTATPTPAPAGATPTTAPPTVTRTPMPTTVTPAISPTPTPAGLSVVFAPIAANGWQH